MSRFSQLFEAAFVPVLMYWHADPIRIKDFGASDFVEVEKAIVSDEVREERRDTDQEIEMVTVRYVQIVTNPDHEDFSGFTTVKIDSTVEIGLSRYLVEHHSRGDHGMEKLKLLRQGRSMLGSRESISE